MHGASEGQERINIDRSGRKPVARSTSHWVEWWGGGQSGSIVGPLPEWEWVARVRRSGTHDF